MIANTKSYLIRSIYDWCINNNFTPFIFVKFYPELEIPVAYVRNDEITFNISVKAVYGLIINDDFIYFMGRFNGLPRKLQIPMSAVKGIFAKEVNRGIKFSSDMQEESQKILSKEQISITQDSLPHQSNSVNKPYLRVVK